LSRNCRDIERGLPVCFGLGESFVDGSRDRKRGSLRVIEQIGKLFADV